MLLPPRAMLQRLSSPILQHHATSRRSLAAFFSSSSFLQPSTTATVMNSKLSAQGQEENDMGLYRLLTPTERELLSEQRQLTETCKSIASKVLMDKNSKTSILSQLESNRFLDLEASFSVVVAGEFNAGKSTLINALLGHKLLESGALPTTDSITIVTSSPPPPTTKSLPLGVIWHTVPNVPVLTDLTLIDTPGTNSTWLDHTERTLRLLPSADLILFVTSADRPFSESERTLLKGIEAYRKNIVIVVNKMDILNAEGGDHGQEAKQAVVDFVMERSSELLGARPIIIPISARDALSAKLMEKKHDSSSSTTLSTSSSSSTTRGAESHPQRSNIWHRSQFASLESFLKDSLTTQTKLQTKLTNPIGLVEGILRECIQVLDEQSQDLQSDVATLNVIQTQFEGWKKELVTDLKAFQQSVTDLVRNQGQRWNILLLRMNFWHFHYNILVDRSKFDQEWEETRLPVVIATHGQQGLKDEIVMQVDEIADSVATRGRAQGQAIIEYLGKRPAMKNQSLVGSVTAASRFEDTRKNLSERLLSAVNITLRSNEEEKEKHELYQSLWTTAALSTGLHTSALGTFMGVMLDLIEPFPGMILAASLVMSGVTCYVLGTSRIAQNHEAKWLDRAKNLEGALVAICDKEVERVNRRILDGVSPYTRFVESEKERIASFQEQCEGLRAVARNLRNRIDKLR